MRNTAGPIEALCKVCLYVCVFKRIHVHTAHGLGKTGQTGVKPGTDRGTHTQFAKVCKPVTAKYKLTFWLLNCVIFDTNDRKSNLSELVLGVKNYTSKYTYLFLVIILYN